MGNFNETISFEIEDIENVIRCLFFVCAMALVANAQIVNSNSQGGSRIVLISF